MTTNLTASTEPMPTSTSTSTSTTTSTAAASERGRGHGEASASWQERFPPRPVEAEWPTTRLGRGDLERRVASQVEAKGSASLGVKRRRGLPVLLDWLEDQPGATWQDRWLDSGADAAGGDWARICEEWLRRRGTYSQSRLELMTSSLLLVVGVDGLRPSLRWLLTGGKKRKLVRTMAFSRDPEGFESLRQRCEQDEALTLYTRGHVVFRSAVIIAAKGGLLAEVTAGDVLEVLDAEGEVRQQVVSAAATIRMLREAGILRGDVPSLREIRSTGQRSVDQLVGRYEIACTPIRDLLVDYLRERQPGVDYNTLVQLAYTLVGCFWADLERHHLGIDSLRLDREVAGAWKRRLRTKTLTRVQDGQRVQVQTERLAHADIMAAVRAFYLDLAEWALEDPSRWAVWVAPCPISQDDLSRRKQVRRRKARMDSRTRARLPVLPALVEATNRWRRDSQALLEVGQRTEPGQSFTAAGVTLTRIDRPHGVHENVWITDPGTERSKLLNRDTEHAFWAWAAIEVLRHTGVRSEELLEISHHSLVQYRLPETGEVVPLLQIAPSKTDTERLLVVSPELAEVLSAVISRVRGPDGTVPLVRAFDSHERIWLPPTPRLFQHRVAGEDQALKASFIATLLDEALAHTGLNDPEDGKPLRFTAHDFRRIFITDAVLNGLPPHIAQVIAGHRDIAVTMGYKAVYPEEAISGHRAFIARRRALRPTEEYRQPTEEEWQQFLGHFQRRKVSIGTCGRAYATPCIHEHACVRCPMLWPDPAQQVRLVEIRDNLKARIAEAKGEGWLGEVEGLQVSLAGAEDKLGQLQRGTATTVDLGIPSPASDR